LGRTARSHHTIPRQVPTHGRRVIDNVKPDKG
jgi:hypothetical protein